MSDIYAENHQNDPDNKPTADAAKLLARAIMDEWAIEIPRRPTMMLPPFFMAEIAARAALNTRPQPAPPSTETHPMTVHLSGPDPYGVKSTAPPAGEPDFHRWLDQKIAEWSAAGGFHDFAVAAKVIRDRLGLAARPKVEDAEVARDISFCRDQGIGWIADLLERLAVELADAYRNKSIIAEFFDRADKRAGAAEAKLAERETELAKAAETADKIAAKPPATPNGRHDDWQHGWQDGAMEVAAALREAHAARQQQKASDEPTAREER